MAGVGAGAPARPGAARFFRAGEPWYRWWLFFTSLAAWVLLQAVPWIYEPFAAYSPRAMTSLHHAPSPLGMGDIGQFLAYHAANAFVVGPPIVEMVDQFRPKRSPRTGRGYLYAIFTVWFLLFATGALGNYLLFAPSHSVVS